MAIEIRLQNHLRGNLIDNVPSVARFLARLPKSAFGGDRCESFVRRFDCAGELGPQLLDKLNRRSCRFSDFPAHMSRNAHDHGMDLSILHELCDLSDRSFVISNRFERVREQAQLIGNRQSNSRSAKVDPQNRIHWCQFGSDLLQFARQFANEFFNSLRLMPVADQNRIGGSDNDQIVNAEKRDARFAVVEDNVVAGVECA